MKGQIQKILKRPLKCLIFALLSGEIKNKVICLILFALFVGWNIWQNYLFFPIELNVKVFLFLSIDTEFPLWKVSKILKI